MKNKDFKKLKKQLISQAEKAESSATETAVISTSTKSSVRENSPKTVYVAKTHPYLANDLKRITWITFIALIALFLIFFLLKNSQFLSDLGDFLYRALHLS